MSTWNYRIQRVHPEPFTSAKDGCECQPDDFYGIVEVYYDDAGEPDGYAEIKETRPYGDTLPELLSDLRLMEKAFEYPVVQIVDDKVTEPPMDEDPAEALGFDVDQLCRAIAYLADKLDQAVAVTVLAEDVADCIEWARERVGADTEKG